MTDIPGGWTSLPLRDVLSMTIGGIWGESEGLGDVDVRVIRVTELRPNGGLDQSTAVTRSVSLKQFESRRLFDGDLLLEKSGGGPKTPVGRVALVVGSPQSAVCANFMQLMRPNREVVEPRYLHLFLMFLHQSGGTVAFQTATTNIRNIKMADYMATDIPLPPLDEQRRIVAILEDHLSRLEVARSGLGGVLTRLGNYRLALHESALSGEVGDRPFDSRGWPRMTLDDLQAEGPAAITDGPFGSNLKSSHYTAGGARVIRLQNIGLGDFLDAQAHISLEHFESLRRHEAMAGDLIVASLGDVLPRVCILPDLGEPAIVKADCIRVRLGESVRPRWVLMAMLTPQARRWAKEQLHGVGRMRLGLKAIREFSLPVPDVATQDAILIAVDDLLLRARNVEASARKTLLLNDALRRSLLAAAFSGQLTKESVSV